MTITYEVALDKNGDGFINMDADPGDPPNLLPDPVTYGNLPYDTEGANTVLRLERAEFAYGVVYWRCSFLGNTAGKFVIGTRIWSLSSVPGGITVQPGATYTFVVWLRDESGHGGGSLSLTVYDGAKNALTTTAAPALTTDTWTQVALTFTPGAGDDEVSLAIERSAGAVNVVVNVAGPMLVAGASAPANFNSGDDLNDHITSDVLALAWRLGMARAFQHTAAPTTGQITVRNTDRRYSPDAPTPSIIAPGYRVRVRAQHDGTQYTLFTGFVDHVEPLPGDQGERTAIIHLCGPERELDARYVLAPLQVDASADTVIAAILARFGGRYITDLDSGDSSFAYIADTWADGIPASVPIRQVTEAERGRFFSDRLARLVFRRRGYNAKVFQITTTLADDMHAMTYVHGEGLVNTVRVMVRPRSIGAPGTVLWTLENAQKVEPGIINRRYITVRLRDSNDRPTGALTIIAPAAYTDYTFNTANDGTGTDVTASVSVSISATEGSAVTLSIQNNHTGTVYLQPGAQLRGTPIIQGDPLLIAQRDALSVGMHGEHTLSINLPLLVTADEADQIARYELARRKTPFGMVRDVTLDAATHAPEVLSRTLSDQITVQETQTGHHADYVIVAEAHRVDLGGASHTATWTLEPLNPAAWWTLGRSRLGDDTRLGDRY